MSWANSKSSDVLWGARKQVLAAMNVIDTMMDVLDPGREERDEYYNNGHNFDLYGESLPLIEMLFEINNKLGRANSAMREVEFRLCDMERKEEGCGTS